MEFGALSTYHGGAGAPITMRSFGSGDSKWRMQFTFLLLQQSESLLDGVDTRHTLIVSQRGTGMAAGLVGAYRYFRSQPEANSDIGTPEPRRTARKAGRNDPCPCGSGKKYKRCCGGAAVN